MARRLAALGAGILLAGSALAASATDQGSAAMQAAARLIGAGGKPLADTAGFRAAIEHRAPPVAAEIPPTLRAHWNVAETQVDGRTVITVSPKVGASRWRIIYLHGGAYVNDLIAPHWTIIDRLMTATGAAVTVPLYPLAPEHDYRAAFAFLHDVYRGMLAHDRAADIVIAGDSAGGGLALGQVLDDRAKGLPLPGRIILFSPWLDLTLANPRARAVEPDDMMLAVDALRLCGRWWAAPTDPKSPILSPLYADLKRLPPIDLFQGTRDIFVVDARTFAAKARAAGNAIDYREYPGGFHVFVGGPDTPEGEDVFHRIAVDLPGRTP